MRAFSFFALLIIGTQYLHFMLPKISIFLFALLAITIFSCKDEKQVLIDEFIQLYEHTERQDYSSKLDRNSLSFYNEITDKENLNIDSITDIGIRYQVPYFATLYLASCKDYMSSTDSPSDFYLYLTSKNISFFSLDEYYEVLKDRTRAEKDGWVAIYRTEGGKNYVSWVKYILENDTYKFDLLYTLKIHEKDNRKIYDELKTDYPDASKKEYFTEIFKAYNIQNCDIETVKNKMGGIVQ